MHEMTNNKYTFNTCASVDVMYQIFNNNGFEVNLSEVTTYRKRNEYLRLKFLWRSVAFFRDLDRNCLETCLIPTRESVLAETGVLISP